MGFINRLKHSWNAFMNKDPTPYSYGTGLGAVSYDNPSRPRLTMGTNDRLLQQYTIRCQQTLLQSI